MSNQYDSSACTCMAPCLSTLLILPSSFRKLTKSSMLEHAFAPSPPPILCGPHPIGTVFLGWAATAGSRRLAGGDSRVGIVLAGAIGATRRVRGATLSSEMALESGQDGHRSISHPWLLGWAIPAARPRPGRPRACHQCIAALRCCARSARQMRDHIHSRAHTCTRF